MKHRYRLVRYGRSGGVYYSRDKEPGQRERTETRDKARATELLVARNEFGHEPAFNLQKARVYLTASDPAVSTRTWWHALDAVIEGTAHDSENRRGWETSSKDAVIQQLLGKVVLETRAEDLPKVVPAGTVPADVLMRRLHNFCIGMNWLPWPALAKKLRPPAKFKNKRVIKPEEHAKIIAREQNLERRDFYEICWDLGASQSDIAELEAEDIKRTGWTVCYSPEKLETHPVAGVPQICLNS